MDQVDPNVVEDDGSNTVDHDTDDTTTTGAQLLYSISENIDNAVATTSSTEHGDVVEHDGTDPGTAQIINIKQEITGDTMEITDLVHAASVVAGTPTAVVTTEEDGLQEGIPVSIDDFVEFHNEQVKTLKDDVTYITKCFEVMYKFKSVFDLIFDECFKEDPHFKYKNVIDDLETDLYQVIGQDEEKYQALLSGINTDVVFTEDDQIEFADGGSASDYETDMDMSGIEPGGNKLVQIVNGVEVFNPNIRKLPGQKTAEPPECPACGYKARCRNKLEAHILEHTDNPLVVCNHESCEMPFELHRMFQHEKDYHPEVNLTCEMCNEMFESKTMLIQHYKLHIRKKDKLKCHLCDYTDIYVGRMDRHKQNVHGLTITKQFKCDFDGCGRIFKDRPSFYTHSLIHKDRSLVYKHKCTIDGCDAVFKRRRNLSVHMAKHGTSRRRYNCNISGCKRTYSRERELQRHIELCHGAGLSTVDGIDGKTTFSFDTNHGLSVKKEFEGDNDSLHMDHHSSSKDADLSGAGDTTGFETTTGSGAGDDENIIYVKNIDQNVTTVNVISCEDMEVDGQPAEHVIEMDENGNSTSNAGKMILLLNKGNDGEQQLELVSSNTNLITEILCEGESTITDECELCSIKFNSPQEMISHLKERHHQYTIRAYRCDFEGCNFATHFRSILGKHKNQVHGGKYKCEVCGKLSKDSGNHNRHRNIHKNVVFRCRYENCEAVYKSPKAYYVHVLTHSNEQPVYRCDFPNCKYVTYYMNTLNVHKLTHSDVRNFFCPYENCGKGFKRNGDLNKHITHSHKGVKRPQKKRKLTEAAAVMYRCTWTNCNYVALDADTLNKHEEEHAATSVEKYKFEVVEEEE